MWPSEASPRSKRPTWILLTVVAVVAGALFVAAHEGHAPLPSRGATVDTAKRRIILAAGAREALGVSVAEVGKTPAPESILAYCTLVPPWSAHAFADAQLGGRVTKLNARPGQRVAQGEVLAEVRGPETESISLEWRTATTQLESANRVVKVLSEAGGAIPETEVLSARNRVQLARNTVELTRTKWLALGLPAGALESTQEAPGMPIRSPLAGTVIHADLSLGKVVEPGEHLFEIVDTRKVWARIGVLERDSQRVRPGLTAELAFTALPGETFGGVIAAVSQAIDSETQLGQAWVELENPADRPARLLPGMKGQARVVLPVPKAALSVPSRSLINNGVDRFVLVEEAGTKAASEYQARSVVVGREAGGLAEIESPVIFPGDRVVSRGAHELGGLLIPDRLSITAETARTIGLSVARVERRRVFETLELSGEVDHPPNQRGAASSSLAGVLMSVRCGPGQRVEKGQELARVFSLELINLQLELLREHLTASLAGAQLEQLRVAGDAGSRRKMIEAEAAFVNSRESRESLRRKMLLLGVGSEQLDGLLARRELVQGLPVQAPSAGVVTGFRSTVGRMIRANEALFEIHDYSVPQIRLIVSEAEMSRVRAGQKCRARLVCLPEKTLEGKVSRTRDSLEGAGGALSAWMDLEGPVPPSLPQGALARVSVETGGGREGLAVPRSAVLREGGSHFVFVQKGKIFQKQRVRPGLGDDLFALLTEGVEEGDTVAATGVEELNTAWLSVR